MCVAGTFAAALVLRFTSSVVSSRMPFYLLPITLVAPWAAEDGGGFPRIPLGCGLAQDRSFAVGYSLICAFNKLTSLQTLV